MDLRSLIDSLLVKRVVGNVNVEINDIKTDSRDVKLGDLFVCLQGFTQDGHLFIEEAVRNGASALLVEKFIPDPANVSAIVIAPDTGRALAVLVNAWFRNDKYPMKLIGVTGTNGKTTTLHMIHHIFTQNNIRSGLIGTLGFIMDDIYEYNRNTTPDTLTLQRYLSIIGKNQGEYALIEASSHGLELGRLRGCNFRTVVFTNLTHDHLDYHHTMDRYRTSKELLFSQLGNGSDAMNKTAVLNADDAASSIIAQHTTAQILRYGLSDSEVTAKQIRLTMDQTDFIVHTPWGEEAINISVPGLHNVYNSLAAISVCLLQGIRLQDISRHLRTFSGIEGRMEDVKAGQPFRVVIDYAHNPDGLNAVLHTLKKTTSGRLICVMGSRGDRDRRKRPIMARIAASNADYLILTSDNPGSEKAEEIISEMVDGLNAEQMGRCTVIQERESAVVEAVRLAEEKDCIVITGRGHEKLLEVGGCFRPLSDIDIVKTAIENMFIGGRK